MSYDKNNCIFIDFLIGYSNGLASFSSVLGLSVTVRIDERLLVIVRIVDRLSVIVGVAETFVIKPNVWYGSPMISNRFVKLTSIKQVIFI